MANNILDSYLVKLGATVDTGSFTTFESTLKRSGAQVLRFTEGSLGGFVKFETGIIGMITSVGVGLIGLADKTAMADQSYRLLGMRMLMTKDSARAMQMSTEELGASLDQIAYDPELNKRFQYLYEQNIKLGKTLGGNFDKNMIAIRGLRTEYKFFGDEVEVLAMGAISKLFEKLGYGTGDLQSKLDTLSNQFMDNIPRWSDEISTNLVPSWNRFLGTLSDGKTIIKELAHDFTVTVGVLSGDKSLQTQTTDFEQFSHSVEHVVDWVTKLSHTFLIATQGAIGLTEALVHGVKEHRLPNFTQHTDKNGKTYFDLWGDGSGAGGNAFLNQMIQQGEQWGAGYQGSNSPASGKKLNVPDKMKSLIANPDFQKIMHGIAMMESSDRQFDVNGKPILGPETDNFGRKLKERAVGRYQLLPSTAKQYGMDANDDQQNTLAAQMYMRDLLNKHKGNVNDALADFGGFHRADPKDYISKVEKYGYGSGFSPSTAPVHIEKVEINVPHALPPAEWSRFVKDSFNDLTDKKHMTTMAQTAAGPFQ